MRLADNFLFSKRANNTTIDTQTCYVLFDLYRLLLKLHESKFMIPQDLHRIRQITKTRNVKTKKTLALFIDYK